MRDQSSATILNKCKRKARVIIRETVAKPMEYATRMMTLQFALAEEEFGELSEREKEIFSMGTTIGSAHQRTWDERIKE